MVIFRNMIQTVFFFKKINLFLFKINYFIFLNHFDVMILKIILKKIKNILF